MAKINVILEAKGRDKGAGKTLKKLTKLADEFGVAATRAAKAGGKLSGVQIAGAAQGRGRAGGTGAGRGRAPAQAGAQGANRAASNRAKREREFDKALSQSVRAAQKQSKILDKEVRQEIKSSKMIENMTREQLEGVEIQREINRRRRRSARRAAETKLGKDTSLKPTNAMGKGARGVQLGANLAIAGAEFEQFGQQVEGGVRASFDAFKDYERGILEVSTLTDEIPIDKIREITSAAAVEFGALPTEQVKAFYSIVSAGATTAAEAQAQLTAANQLAVGGMATQEEAVLAISKAVANFGVTSEEAADSLFTAVKDGQTTVSGLATAMPQVAQAASSVGLSLQETNAAIAVLSKRGATAKISANNLKAALSNLQNPTKKAREEAERLGIEFNSGSIKAAGGLEKWLISLKAAKKGTEAFDQDTVSKLFGSVEAQAAIGGMIGGLDDLNSGLADQANMMGAAGKASDKMMTSSAKKAEIMEAKFELLKIQAGESLVPALTDLAEEIGPIIKSTTEWIKENPKLAGTIGKIAIGVAVGARAIGALTSVMSMGSSIVGIFRGGMDKFGGSVDATTGKVNKMGKASGAGIAGPFAVATVAIIAFEAALSSADKVLDRELDRLDKLNKATEEGGLGVSFKTAEGKDKSERDLLAERRQRLVEDVRGKEAVTQAGSASQLKRQLGHGSIGAAAETFGVGAIGILSGAGDVQAQQSQQAALDLARFDEQFGAQLGLSSQDQFRAGGGGAAGTGATVDAMMALLDPLKTIANNTSPSTGLGPSMDAGLV